MDKCVGQVEIVIDGRTNHAAGAQLICQGECTKGECKERPGKIRVERDPADPKREMIISETWCSCDDKEPEGCHIVLEHNLTKHTFSVRCHGACDDGKRCRPIKVAERTDHVYQPKEGPEDTGFDVDDNFAILVRLTYECQCF